MKWSIAKRIKKLIGYGMPIIVVDMDLELFELCQMYFDCYAVIVDPGRQQAKVPLFHFYLMGDGNIIYHLRRALCVISDRYDPLYELMTDRIYVNCGERHRKEKVLTRTGTPWLLPLNLVLFGLNLPLLGGKAVYYHEAAGIQKQKQMSGLRKHPVRRFSNGRVRRTIQGQRLDQRKSSRHHDQV